MDVYVSKVTMIMIEAPVSTIPISSRETRVNIVLGRFVSYSTVTMSFINLLQSDLRNGQVPAPPALNTKTFQQQIKR